MSMLSNNEDFSMDADFDFGGFCAGVSPSQTGVQMNGGNDHMMMTSEGAMNGDSNTQKAFNGNEAAANPQDSQPNPLFWQSRNSMYLQNGMLVRATNSELWASYEELHMALIGLYDSGEATFVDQPAVPSTPAFNYPTPVTPMQAQAHGQGMTLPTSGYPTLTSPFPVTPSTPGSATPSKTTTSSKRKRAAPVPGVSLPPYQPSADLGSAAAAREYLSRVDSNEAHKLDIPRDDIEKVKGKMQIYAARAYNALLHAYDTPAELDDRKQKYIEQQDSAVAVLQKMLTTRAQIKAARASCILLIDAAIATHENGVSRERFQKHENADFHNLRIDDSFKIAVDLTCSARVEGLIAAVKTNKLVAKDVLEQKNLMRFAECPEAYPRRKYAYLRSNKTRQDKVDDRAADDEANGNRGRGKLARRAKCARYADEEDSDDEVVP